MADNVVADAGSGGATFKTDEDIGDSTHAPYVKLMEGAANTFNIVSDANGLPVDATGQGDVPITLDGEVVTETNSGTIASDTTSIDGKIAVGAGLEATAVRVTLPTDGTGVVTETNSASIKTAVETVAAAVSTQMQVDLVDGNVTNAGTFAVQISDTSFAVADGNALGEGVLVQGDDGTDRKNINVDATTGDVQVDVTNTVTADVTTSGDVPITLSGEAVVLGAGTAEIGKLAAGTAAIGKLAANDGVDIGDVDVTSLPASTNTLEVVGDVAHDAAAAGNPVAIAARATNNVEGLTQVAAADATFVTSDLNGCLVTRPHTTLEEIITAHQTNTDGSEDAVTNFGAGGAGIHNYITTIVVNNSSATDGSVVFHDGTGGTAIFIAPAPTVGGSVINLPVPLKQPTANTGLFFNPSAAMTTITVSLVGFQAQG